MGSHKCYCMNCLGIPAVYIESVGYLCKKCVEDIINCSITGMSITEIVKAYKVSEDKQHGK